MTQKLTRRTVLGGLSLVASKAIGGGTAVLPRGTTSVGAISANVSPSELRGAGEHASRLLSEARHATQFETASRMKGEARGLVRRYGLRQKEEEGAQGHQSIGGDDAEEVARVPDLSGPAYDPDCCCPD